MKKLSIFRFALIYAGFFLGAGYVSGKELWEYFGRFGYWGLAGLALAFALLYLFGISTLRLVKKTGVLNADRLMIPWEKPRLRKMVTWLECFSMLAVIIVMGAGAAAVTEQFFHWNYTLCALLFFLLVLFAAFLGLKGVAAAFSISVPVLTAAVILFAVMTASRGGMPAPEMIASSGRGWVFSSLTFVSYNIFLTIALLAPFAPYVEKKRILYGGPILSMLLLAVIAFCALYAMVCIGGAIEEELPMLRVASECAPWAGFLYAILLLMAMFGTALSSFVALVRELCEASPWIAEHSRLSASCLCIVSFLGSLFGFGNMVTTLYPICGYLSAAFLIPFLVHDFVLTRKKKVF